MCNYFSIGVESRIGIGFDKVRTGNQHCNKLCYGWEGLKKLFCCCTKTTKIKEVIDYVAVFDETTREQKVLFTTDSKNCEEGRH
jgi:diacylglycerol kinase (ATP)